MRNVVGVSKYRKLQLPTVFLQARKFKFLKGSNTEEEEECQTVTNNLYFNKATRSKSLDLKAPSKSEEVPP